MSTENWIHLTQGIIVLVLAFGVGLNAYSIRINTNRLNVRRIK